MANRRAGSMVFRAVRILVLVYLGLILLMAGCQRRYIYYPQRADEESLLRTAAAMGLEPWRLEAGDGEIVGWRPRRGSGDEPVARVVVFHGNAGMALDRGFYLDGFGDLPGRWEVWLYEYPGYGARPGRPGERRFVESAAAALAEMEFGPEDRLFLVGESLGSGVATRLAAEFPERVDGLLLLTPFTRLADVAAHHFPFLPVRLLLVDRFDNVAALKEYRGPVAVLLAELDRVVPARLGQELYEAYEGPKKLWIQEGMDHNTLDLSPGHPWWRELGEFLDAASGR